MTIRYYVREKRYHHSAHCRKGQKCLHNEVFYHWFPSKFFYQVKTAQKMQLHTLPTQLSENNLPLCEILS